MAVAKITQEKVRSKQFTIEQITDESKIANPASGDMSIAALTDGTIIRKDPSGVVRQLLDETNSQAASYAATATSDGLTTGIIPAGVSRVFVTSANANNIIALPAAAAILDEITLHVATNGFELRTNDPATVSLNNVSGAGKEAAIPANTTVKAIKTSATAWVCFTIDNLGALSTGPIPD